MKIDIVGSVASGKTTLARELSEIYRTPYYEKDNVVWKRTEKGDVKRTDEERDKLFKEILSQEAWIVEGSPRKVLMESFEYSDYIILLDVNTIIRLIRVIRRWFRQKIGKEKFNSKPTMKFLYYNVKWVFEYNIMRKKLIETILSYGDKAMICKNSKEAKRVIEKIYTK